MSSLPWAPELKKLAQGHTASTQENEKGAQPCIFSTALALGVSCVLLLGLRLRNPSDLDLPLTGSQSKEAEMKMHIQEHLAGNHGHLRSCAGGGKG